MSVEAMSWVLNHARKSDGSRLGPSQKLVLLGIANHADRNGENAWPALETLADYADLSASQTRRHLRALEADGLVVTEQHGGGDRRTRGDRRPNLYSLPRMNDPAPMHGRDEQRPRASAGHDPAPSAERPRAHARGTVLEPSDEPSDDSPALFLDATSGTVSTAETPSKPRQRNPLWDALVEVFGEPVTASEKKNYGAVVRELKAVPDVSGAEVLARAHEARRMYPEGTVRVVTTHWTQLGREAQRRASRDGPGSWESLYAAQQDQAS